MPVGEGESETESEKATNAKMKNFKSSNGYE